MLKKSEIRAERSAVGGDGGTIFSLLVVPGAAVQLAPSQSSPEHVGVHLYLHFSHSYSNLRITFTLRVRAPLQGKGHVQQSEAHVPSQILSHGFSQGHVTLGIQMVLHSTV